MTQEDQRLSGALQENILTLLCFDDEHCKLVRAAITPHLFDSKVYREVAGHAINFIDQFGEAIKEHLPDHLENILEGEDARKAATYKKLLDDLFTSRASINPAYVVAQLNKFVRLQKFKSALVEAVERLDANGDIDAAETIMQKGMASNVSVFEAGTRLDDPDDVGAILDSPEEEGFTLNIPELDIRGIYPRRKELFAFVAARGKGKSWFGTHCAKRALLQRWSVLVVSLEMSEKNYAARMLQSFFSISRRDANVKVTRLEMDKDGELGDLVREEMQRETMRDPGIRESLKKKAKREFRRRKPLRIKSFGSGTLNIQKLRAYIEGLIRFEKWSPDLIIVDYPRLFDLDAKNLRLELGKVNVDLRGLASELNAACVIFAQGNRDSESAFLVTGDMVEEDISLKATADVVLTYSQTKQEYGLGLARLLADKVRNDESGVQVLISQAYAVGQFCLDSARIGRDYWDKIKGKEERDERKERRTGDDRRSGGDDRRGGEERRRSRDDDEQPRRRRRSDD